MTRKIKLNNYNIFVLLVFFFMSFFVLFNSEKAQAMIIKKDLGTLAAEAQIIMTGKVTAIQSGWEDKKIYTYVTVSKEELFKGAGDEKVIIKVPGGTVGEITCRVSDTPVFQKGEEILAFLKASGKYYELVGARQGKYTVQKDKIVGLNVTGKDISALISDKIEEKQKVKKEETVTEQVYTTRQSFPLSQNGRSFISNNVQPEKQDSALSGSSSASQPYWTTILDEGFESDWPADPKWDLYGAPACAYTWGRESYQPYTGSYSAWCAGTCQDVCGDLNPAVDNYQNNMDAWMVYGPFDLSDATSARMTFDNWTKSVEEGYDQDGIPYESFYYGYSTNDKVFFGNFRHGDRTPWHQEYLPLDEVCGQSQVWVGFCFYSDETNNDKGTFVDNVLVEKYSGPLPEITGVSPDSGRAVAKDLTTYEAAEDSTEVTISGSSFGSSQGDVAFWAGQGNIIFTYATIKSWSDDQISCLVPGGASSYNADDGAGNLYVITSDNLLSNPSLFRVTFSCMGGTVPGNKLTYKVNANTADCAGEENSIKAAANTWNSAGSKFLFKYGGATNKTTTGIDSENSVIWVNIGYTDWLAQTWTYFNTAHPNNILESDTELSDYYNWSTAVNPPGQYDTQEITTHEFGHAFGLLDLYGTEDREKTMYGYCATGESRARTLEPDDIAGIRYLYGLVGDMNQDGSINILDLLWMASVMGPVTPQSQIADVNYDGVVNILDLLRVASNIGVQQ